MKTIKAIITPQGEVQIETSGFRGGACADSTKALEAALGVTVSSKKKPEYFSRITPKNQQKITP